MAEKTLSRRMFLAGSAALGASLLVAACQPKATEKPAPGASEAQGAEKQATRPAASEPAGAAAITLRVLGRAGLQGDAHREFFKRYQSEHPDIKIEEIETTYEEIPQQTEALYRAGNSPDVSYQAIRWSPYLAYKGLFLYLEDHISANYEKYDFDDFYPAFLNACKLDDKTYGLPEFSQPTSRPFIMYNIDMFEAAGVPVPEGNEWTLDQWRDAAIKLTDPEKGVYGIDAPNVASFYDWDAFVDGFGSHIIDEPVGYGKRFNYVDNPENKSAVEWHLSLIEAGAAPKRGGTVPNVNMFAAQLYATAKNGTFSIPSLSTEIGDKFRWGMALMKGPVRRGSGIFVNPWCISSQSKHASEAFDFVAGTLCGKEIGLFAFETGLGSGLQARKSEWNSEAVAKAHPGFGVMRDWMNEEGDKFNPFPLPWNLRFQEFYDTFLNEVQPLSYGEVTWDEAAPVIQRKCQEIMDLDRP